MSAAFKMKAPEPVTLATLASRPLWVAWQTQLRKEGDKKPTKLPYAPGGPDSLKARANDPATWGTRQQAEARASRLPKPFGTGGVGLEFADLGDGRSAGGIDLDRCRDAATGALAPWAQHIIDRFASYAEISPSGTGVKVFFVYPTADTPALRSALGTTVDGKPKHSKLWSRRHQGDHPPAIEFHISNRYFAVTDDLLPGCTTELREVPTADLLRLIEVDGRAFVAVDAPLGDQADETAAAQEKARIKRTKAGSSDSSRSRDAFIIGGNVRRSGSTYEAMCEAIRDDPRTAEWYRDKGIANGGRELQRIWAKTEPQDHTSAGDAGKSAEDPAKVLILSAGSPLRSAREFLKRRHTRDDIRTLHHQNSTFYSWQGSHYVERAPEEMRAQLYDFLDEAKRLNDKGHSLPFDPTKSKVANVIEATAAEAQLSRLTRPPAWLGTADNPNAAEIISCANTLLHLPTMQTRTHTPEFFTLNALDFDYQATAPTPSEWLKFLSTVWPDDPQAISTLQEIFGLCLTGDTKYQKAFLIVGPMRSGKGTIARVLAQLLGAANVCGPTLSGLGTNFGLAPLIGKRLAIVSDARLSGKADQQVIVERLLSITGEDGLTIDRKFRDGWTGRLDVRFLILTNELPRLTDSSGALASRFVILTMTRSFLGKEDLTLASKLAPELPGILLWAIEGWKRLTARGHFVQPASSKAAQEELEKLGSPIGAFLRDCCTVGQGQAVRCDELYKAWCDWCREQGRDHPGTVQIFGRDLRAAVPGLTTTQARQEGDRTRYFEGVGFTADYAASTADRGVSRDGTRSTPLYPEYYDDDPGPQAYS